MPSHFSSIGIPVTSGQALEALAERAIRSNACEVFGTPAGRYFRWRSASGAELWLQADRKRRLMGANPHFGGTGRVLVGLTARLQRPTDSELDGAFHGWAAPADPADPESGEYPFVFDVPDAARHLGLALPRVEPVQVAAFAHELTLWPDETAYLAASASGSASGSASASASASASTSGSASAAASAGEPSMEPALATRSFIPTGLFAAPEGEAGPRAEAVMTGLVREAERRENELTGEPFWWILLESLGGTFDVVADPELLPVAPRPGAVAQGAFWLSGRLPAHDKAKRTLLDRMRGR